MTASTDVDRELLHELLVAAATAHGVYESEQLGGVHDEAWPEWYAHHMAEALAARGVRFEPVAPEAATAAVAAGGDAT